MKDSGDVWRQWRESHKMSRVHFAEALGLTPKTIYNIEKSKTTPNWVSQMRFDALKVRYAHADGK